MKIFLTIFSIYMFLVILEFIIKKTDGYLELVMGLAGDGKSTYMGHLVKKYTKKGIPVYCNHHVLDSIKLDPKWLGKYMLENCVIIVDEAQLEFDNRNFKEFTKELKFFFSNYRHFKCKVYIISQSWEDLDVKIRRQAKKIYILSPSIIPFTIMLKRLKLRLDVNEDGTDIVQLFKGGIFSYRFKTNFTVWKYFDSYSKPDLPSLPYLIKWGETTTKRGKIKPFIINSLSSIKLMVLNATYKLHRYFISSNKNDKW